MTMKTKREVQRDTILLRCKHYSSGQNAIINAAAPKSTAIAEAATAFTADSSHPSVDMTTLSGARFKRKD